MHEKAMIDDPVIWTPLMDLYELDNNYVLNAELPGVDRKDVKVELHGSELIVRGERKMDAVCAKENYHRLEGRRGKFMRSFSLHDPVDEELIQITLEDGVLHVALPKTSEKNKLKRSNR
jgi:HSP20 family protein